MSPSKNRVKAFLSSNKKITKGLEKENLRSDSDGKISNKKYPSALGKFHFNNHVTLDYSEPHLELVTPVFEDNTQLIIFLKVRTPSSITLREIFPSFFCESLTTIL